MEFFAHVRGRHTAAALQSRLEIDQLPGLCASIDRVLSRAGDDGVIYCVWGEFQVHRQTIRGGVRFTLPNCPNALAWTLTVDGSPEDHGRVTVHCTIDREHHEADFVASIEQFVKDWAEGLERISLADGAALVDRLR